jgi:hypothetical protein
LNGGFSPVPARSGVAGEDIPPVLPADDCSTASACPAKEEALSVWPDALVEVQPATRIPVTRIAETISIIILLFFI